MQAQATEAALAQALAYLESSEATACFAQSPYWPKWDGPWWHMLLLYELGLADRIPERAVAQLVAALKRVQPYFFAHEVPTNGGPPATSANLPCHCQLGCVYQVLAATRVDVDAELPWMRPWFLRYQMADGGLNCDDTAYTATPQASSIVGTSIGTIVAERSMIARCSSV